MNRESDAVGSIAVLPRDRLDDLFQILRSRKYHLAGPTLRDGAIVIDYIHSSDDLPTGWSDRQEPASYRTVRRTDSALFAYAAPARGWKQFLLRPSERLLVAETTASGLRFTAEETSTPRLALIGITACDLAAASLFDRSFHGNGTTDSGRKSPGKSPFVVALRCSQPASTCFCGSFAHIHQMSEGCDLAMTELMTGEHRFLFEVFTKAGADILKEAGARPAARTDTNEARAVWECAKHKGRSLDAAGVRAALAGAFEHPAWNSISSRCLGCGNCTMVCPTCFCNTVQDTSDLDGQSAARSRTWDSCFSIKFSYIHGGSVRASLASRFRQRILHKLLWAEEQFGTPGCVGCGRCIAWCPAGIDITEEIKAFQR